MARSTLVAFAERICTRIRFEGGVSDTESFNYVGMLHSSMSRHEVPPSERGRAAAESLLATSAERFNVVPRFLAGPYLMDNPRVDGRPATFLPLEDEVTFIEANSSAVSGYERAFRALREVRRMGLRDTRAASLLRRAADALKAVQETNLGLARRLGVPEFSRIRKYYDPVTVGGQPYVGVAAGDQPWVFLIDIALGVFPGRVRHEDAEARLNYMRPAEQDELLRGLDDVQSGLLDGTLLELTGVDPWKSTTGCSSQAWVTAGIDATTLRELLGAAETHAAVSKAHWALVAKFIVTPSGMGKAALGSTGRTVDWLEDLIAMRGESAPVLALREATRLTPTPA